MRFAYQLSEQCMALLSLPFGPPSTLNDLWFSPLHMIAFWSAKSVILGIVVASISHTSVSSDNMLEDISPEGRDGASLWIPDVGGTGEDHWN